MSGRGSVFTTDDVDIIAKWEADQERHREWHAAVGEWAKQYPEHKAVLLTSGGARWLSGLSGEWPGALWRSHPRYSHWIPRNRSKAEKALHAEVAALKVEKLGDLAGMPTDIWSRMPHFYTHGVKTYGGRIYVTWSCPADAVEESKEFDGSRWRRCPLSEFYAAQEAAGETDEDDE